MSNTSNALPSETPSRNTSPAIKELEDRLALVKQALTPVIIEKTIDNEEQVVYVNKTFGTVRTDLKGGEKPRYEDRPQASAASLVNRPFDTSLGKIVKENEDERMIQLNSGTVRTDVKTVEKPKKEFHFN